MVVWRTSNENESSEAKGYPRILIKVVHYEVKMDVRNLKLMFINRRQWDCKIPGGICDLHGSADCKWYGATKPHLALSVGQQICFCCHSKTVNRPLRTSLVLATEKWCRRIPRLESLAEKAETGSRKKENSRGGGHVWPSREGRLLGKKPAQDGYVHKESIQDSGTVGEAWLTEAISLANLDRPWAQVYSMVKRTPTATRSQ